MALVVVGCLGPLLWARLKMNSAVYDLFKKIKWT
jgi:hypothetical protein